MDAKFEFWEQERRRWEDFYADRGYPVIDAAILARAKVNSGLILPVGQACQRPVYAELYEEVRKAQ